ncbi:TPA: CD3337/EF1877 family mobilome membrane protein [Staphylococcus aureus]
MKSFFKILCVFSLLIAFMSSQPVHAVENQDSNMKIENQKMGKYKDDNPNYAVETLNYKDIKELEEKKEEKEKENQGWGGKINDAVGSVVNFIPNTIGNVKDDTANAIKDQGLFVMSKISNGLMQWTVFMSDATLNFFHFSNQAELLNFFIDEVEGFIQDISGIDNSGINGNGLFGQFIGLISVLVLFGVMYNAFLKRAPVQALKGLLTPIICMTLAMILIANMGNFLKGVNTITNGTMNEIVTFGAGVKGDDDMNTTEDVLHKAMVYTPYVNMMFGTDDDSVVSQDRVKAIMTEKNEKERKKLLKEEYKNGNNMVHPDMVPVQILYGFISVICGSLLGVAVLMVSLAFFILQLILIFWAFVAPFALMWACLPGQFLVAQKFVQKLITPFIYKIGLGVLVMVLGIIVGIVSRIDVSNGIVGYGLQMFLIFAVFITLFILRNKVMSVFVVTKEGQLLNEMIRSNDYVPNAMGSVAGKAIGTAIGGSTGYLASHLVNVMGNQDSENDQGSTYGTSAQRPQMYKIDDYSGSKGGEMTDGSSDSTNDDPYYNLNNYSDNDELSEEQQLQKDNNERDEIALSRDNEIDGTNDFNEQDTDNIDNGDKYARLSEHMDRDSIEGKTSSDDVSSSGISSSNRLSLKDYIDNDTLKGARNDIEDQAIKYYTGVDGKTLKSLEAQSNEIHGNDPIRKKAREMAGTNWEDQPEYNGEDEEIESTHSDESREGLKDKLSDIADETKKD